MPSFSSSRVLAAAISAALIPLAFSCRLALWSSSYRGFPSQKLFFVSLHRTSLRKFHRRRLLKNICLGWTALILAGQSIAWSDFPNQLAFRCIQASSPCRISESQSFFVKVHQIIFYFFALLFLLSISSTTFSSFFRHHLFLGCGAWGVVFLFILIFSVPFSSSVLPYLNYRYLCTWGLILA